MSNGKKKRKNRPVWMRKEGMGSIFILLLVVVSVFTFLAPTGGDGQDQYESRDIQLALDNAGLKDVMSMLPSGMKDMLFTDFGNETGQELVLWASGTTGAPSESMLGRQATWFANANYPQTQGSSSFEIIEHWLLFMSVGNATIYEYPNILTPYQGINITRHPNFYYTPNTDPLLIAAVDKDLQNVLDLWLQTNNATGETAAAEYAALLEGIPDGADWAIFAEYKNSTSPLNYSDEIFAAISTVGVGEYYLNISTHIRQGGQPNASLFATPANATGDTSFVVEGDYVYYGLQAEMEVISSELFRMGVLFFNG